MYFCLHNSSVKNWSKRIQGSVLSLCAVLLLTPGVAQAQNQAGLAIIEEYNAGVETARAVWSSDPGAPISVTKSSVNPEVWSIDLTGSGHATLGGGDFPFNSGSVMTWIEPENPGFYNNLFYVDDLHWRLESEQAVPANTNNDGVFGIFGNGTSIYAGSDHNGDSVYASVTELQVPEPSTLALLALGGLAFIRRRR